MFEAEIARIADQIEAIRNPDRRFIIAIAGPPASGKSTLAAMLKTHFGDDAALVPMDGFHLDNRILKERGLLARKGAPDTFDVAGYCNLLSRIADGASSVVYPIFDRDRDLSIAGAGVVEQKRSLIIVEGNYLLFRNGPWSAVRNKYNLTLMLSCELQELERRLIQRWFDHGLPMDQARTRARENDLKNAELIKAESVEADIFL